jgi:RNA polymerase sigma-70 factor, ECF subfamily
MKNKFNDQFREEMVVLLPRLWRFAISLARQTILAEDLVQQTCERALEREEQFSIGTRQDHWMFAIMASLWKNHLRSERVRTGHGTIGADEISNEGDIGLVEQALLRSTLHQAVMELPLWQREAVLLVYVEDMSYRDASETLKLPLGTVMSRLASAKVALASRLNPDATDAQDKRSYHGEK